MPMNERAEAIIARLREEFGRNCQQEGNAEWRFEVFTEDGRSQVVNLHVRERWGGAGRDISRFVASSPIGPVRAGLRFDPLLRKNAELDVGAIAIEDVWTQDNSRRAFVVFRATHLVSTADYPEIWELIRKTAGYADDLERSVYSRDLY